MDILEAIRTRASVRDFTDEEVTDAEIEAVLEAGRRAPSGLNNQPWRFVVVRDRAALEEVARYTRYERVVKGARALIAVFYHAESGYDRDKDMHGIGACGQTMWLAAHSLGLGMCWVGEILNRRVDVERALGVEGLELMAVMCLGRPAKGPKGPTPRIPLKDLVVKRL